MADRRLLLLGGAYLAAIAWGVYEWQRPVEMAPTATAPVSVKLPVLDLPTPLTLSVDAYDAFIERPLFIVGRRPLSSEGTPTTQADVGSDAQPGNVQGLHLTAVLSDSGRLSALIEQDTGDTQRVRAGESLGPWKITEIKDDRVILGGRGGAKTLLLHDFATRRATPPAASSSRRLTFDRIQAMTAPAGIAQPPQQPEAEPSGPLQPTPSIKDPVR